MRSADGTRTTGAQTTQHTSAPLLRVAVAAQGAEALGLCVAVVFNVVDWASGNTSTNSNSNPLGFIALELVFAFGWAWVAWGIARVRPWSRTPAMLSQVFTAMIALWLLEAHRYAWGIPALLLAIAGCVGLFAPSSFRALMRSSPPGE